jgi:hypothetical protein
MSERAEDKGGQWNLRRDSLSSSLGVSTDFERSTERRELWTEAANVTRSAGLSGLLCEVRHGECAGCGKGSRQKCQDSDDPHGCDRISH